MARDVTIIYTNESDNTTSDFLVFSQPVSPCVSAALAAWQVIEHIGRGDSHRFRYTVESADFEFHPRISVGFGQRPVTTPFLDYAVMSDAWTEVDLLGMSSLTIAATGSAASGYQFVLRDIVGDAS